MKINLYNVFIIVLSIAFMSFATNPENNTTTNAEYIAIYHKAFSHAEKMFKQASPQQQPLQEEPFQSPHYNTIPTRQQILAFPQLLAQQQLAEQQLVQRHAVQRQAAKQLEKEQSQNMIISLMMRRLADLEAALAQKTTASVASKELTPAEEAIAARNADLAARAATAKRAAEEAASLAQKAADAAAAAQKAALAAEADAAAVTAPATAAQKAQTGYAAAAAAPAKPASPTPPPPPPAKPPASDEDAWSTPGLTKKQLAMTCIYCPTDIEHTFSQCFYYNSCGKCNQFGHFAQTCRTKPDQIWKVDNRNSPPNSWWTPVAMEDMVLVGKNVDKTERLIEIPKGTPLPNIRHTCSFSPCANANCKRWFHYQPADADSSEQTEEDPIPDTDL